MSSSPPAKKGEHAVDGGSVEHHGQTRRSMLPAAPPPLRIWTATRSTTWARLQFQLVCDKLFSSIWIEPPFALVCGWRYPLLIIAKGGSFSTVSTLRLFSPTSITCGSLYEKSSKSYDLTFKIWCSSSDSNPGPTD